MVAAGCVVKTDILVSVNSERREYDLFLQKLELTVQAILKRCASKELAFTLGSLYHKVL